MLDFLQLFFKKLSRSQSSQQVPKRDNSHLPDWVGAFDGASSTGLHALKDNLYDQRVEVKQAKLRCNSCGKAEDSKKPLQCCSLCRSVRDSNISILTNLARLYIPVEPYIIAIVLVKSPTTNQYTNPIADHSEMYLVVVLLPWTVFFQVVNIQNQWFLAKVTKKALDVGLVLRDRSTVREYRRPLYFFKSALSDAVNLLSRLFKKAGNPLPSKYDASNDNPKTMMDALEAFPFGRAGAYLSLRVMVQNRSQADRKVVVIGNEILAVCTPRGADVLLEGMKPGETNVKIPSDLDK